MSYYKKLRFYLKVFTVLMAQKNWNISPNIRKSKGSNFFKPHDFVAWLMLFKQQLVVRGSACTAMRCTMPQLGDVGVRREGVFPPLHCSRACRAQAKGKFSLHHATPESAARSMGGDIVLIPVPL